MQPLIDGDVLRYEIGFAAEAGCQQEGVPSFDYVQELFEMRVANICAMVGATAPPIMFLTGKHNFRDQLATRQPYKTRASNKPWHFNNLTAFINWSYDVRLTEGLEADDLLAIEQCRREAIFNGNPFYSGPTVRSIICTRDKDLRAVPGWHYGWELGAQPEFGPELVDELGWLKLSSDRKSIKGTGLRFFYSQLITGDRTDSILGVEGLGPVKAMEILEAARDERELFESVRSSYVSRYGSDSDRLMLESGRLLWMTRELEKNGSPRLWEFPK